MAENEYPEQSPLDAKSSALQQLLSVTALLGKTKKEKEKAIAKGDLHDLLMARQEDYVAKVTNKRKSAKK